MAGRILLALILVGTGATFTSAQETRGTLLGRVVDATGAVIPSVEVRALNPATGTTASSRSNESGNYVIPYLLPGTYTVQAELSGFKRFVREGVQIRVNDSVAVDIAMATGDVAEIVEITAVTPLLETSSASLGQVVDQKRILELPILAGNPFQLVQLSPGVSNTTDLRARNASATNATSQLSTDGNAQYSNEFSIDGIPNTASNGREPRVAFNPPTTAVSEFKVQTVTYDASLGHTPGAIINVSTTSGTNKLHGEMHEWFRNRILDAPTFFQNSSGQELPVYQNNRYGVSAGGPVYLPHLYNGHNKSFWFYAFEGNPFITPTPRTWTVPTPKQLQGDFSDLLRIGGQYQIYDPSTIRAEAGGRFRRDPFPGNIIPASRISPVARSLSAYWPAPNQPGTSDGRNNYFNGAQNSRNKYFVHIGRFDHVFNENHRLYVRLHYDFWEEDKNHDFQNQANGIILNRRNHGGAVDDVLVFNPTFLLNMRYGFVHNEFPERRVSRGIDLAALGFSNSLVALTNRDLATLPRINMDYRGFGNWESGDGTISSIIHSASGNFSKLAGGHMMRFGLDFRVYREFADRFQTVVAPDLTYSTNWTRGPLDNSTSAPFGQDLASFLLGLPTGGSMTRSAGGYAEQEKFLAFYWQDDWKLTPKLTVNFGLRYEIESPLTERFDRTVTEFDFSVTNPIQAAAKANYALNPIPELPAANFQTRGGLLFAGVDGRPRTFWNADTNNLMPRFGFAYAPLSGTVIRGGYGIFFDTVGTNRNNSIQLGFSQPTPFVASLDNGLNFIGSTANPFPNGLLPALGPAGGLSTNVGQGVSFFYRRMLNPYAQRWSLGVQQQLTREVVLELSYVGNRGTHLPITRELNATPSSYLSTLPVRDVTTINFLSAQVRNPFAGLLPGTNLNGTNVARSQLLRPYPHFTSIQSFEPQGFSWYHSLQGRVEKRFSQGYTLNVAYTWSKFMEATSYLNETDPLPEQVVSTFDRTHRLVVSGIYELPFGRGRRFLSDAPGFWNVFAGGWQLNAIVTRQSGQPLGFGNAIFNGDLKKIMLSRGERDAKHWFNVNAGFERNSPNQLGSNIRTFPSRFSGIRGDGDHMWDVSALKNFALTETWTLQFRAEAYNALNHPNFANPNTTPTNSTFGEVNAQDGNPRQWQLARKLMF